MNTIGSDLAAQPTQTEARQILYFRFRNDVGEAIRQVEFDLLQTNLSRHRGYDDVADEPHRDGYWAVVATSDVGMGADAVEYTINYLRSIPVVNEFSITTAPPMPK